MARKIVLKNAFVFTGIDPELSHNKTILIDGNRIDRICDSTESFENAQTIDLTGYTVLPGFIDCHMHMLLNEIPDKEACMTTHTPGGDMYPNADSAMAYMGVNNCRKMLRSGFTTVIDAGGRNFVECALREAINKGFVDGPNYYIAGKQITTNFAHFVGFSTDPYGPYGMRKAIRDLVWWGVDLIKLQLSPPIRMLGRNSQVTDFTVDEVQAAIDEAHNYGLPVHAHLRGPKSIKQFLSAGGDFVVHGTGMDDEGIELMLKNNAVLLPTLKSPSINTSPEMAANKNSAVVDLLQRTAVRHWESVKKAYQAGVKIAFSTDAGTLDSFIGKNADEFLNLQRIGMSPFEALQTATTSAAKVVDREKEIGQIKEGFVADLVVLDGDPLSDLSATGRVVMTIKNGKIMYDGRDV